MEYKKGDWIQYKWEGVQKMDKIKYIYSAFGLVVTKQGNVVDISEIYVKDLKRVSEDKDYAWTPPVTTIEEDYEI